MFTDVDEIAARMRRDDIVEIELSSGSSPREALARGFSDSDECYTVDYQGNPALMFGAKEDVIWMLATPDLERFGRAFARSSKGVLQNLAQGYEFLHNCCYEHNYVHLRWLAWCGAEFLPPIEYPSGAHFVPFRIYANV